MYGVYKHLNLIRVNMLMDAMPQIKYMSMTIAA